MKKASVTMLAIPVATSMLLLVGCSGDSKPEASRSSTASATSSASATSTSAAAPSAIAPATTAPIANPSAKADPSIPSAARAPNAAGALAFTRYFVERWNTAWTGPRTGILYPLCHSSSEACDIYEATATRLAKQGRRYRVDPVTIKSIKILEVTNAKRIEVLALVTLDPVEIDKAGKSHRIDKSLDFHIRFILLNSGKGFQLSFVQYLK